AGEGRFSPLLRNRAAAWQPREDRHRRHKSRWGFQPAGPGDGPYYLAVFPDQARDTLAFRTDDDNNWVFAALVRIKGVLTAGIQANNLVAILLEFLDGAGHVGLTRDRQTCRGTRGGTPGHSGHRCRATLGDNHAVAAESSNGADNRA